LFLAIHSGKVSECDPIEYGVNQKHYIAKT
jgi:hypothetical protein